MRTTVHFRCESVIILNADTQLGQYISYRDLLAELTLPFQVYLAMSREAHRSVFKLDAVQAIARRERLLLLVVDVKEEVVTEWIE
jgi:hypothetical protein